MKKKVCISYDKLPRELKVELKEEFPYGFDDEVKMYPAPKPFYGFLYETEEASYLIKVDKKKDYSDVAIPDDEADEDATPAEDVEYDD